MEHRTITQESTLEEGEYLFYEPLQQIGLCASQNFKDGLIQAFIGGRLLKDKMENFKKIELNAAEQKMGFVSRVGCKGCKGR